VPDWEWDEADLDVDAVALEPADGEPEGEQLPEIEVPAVEESQQPIDDGEPVDDFDPTPIEPCALLERIESWPDWLGSDGLVVELEDGDACGWRNRADDFRLAIAVFETAPGMRYLTGLYDQGTPVEYADRSTWLEGWPVGQSSTLVVESGPRDLIIEVSARTDAARQRLHEAALHFAREILVYLP
jgi:hypothetical protein